MMNELLKGEWKRIRPRKLKTKLILFILVLVVFQISVIGLISIFTISEITEEQLGKRALKVSQTVSLIPEIRELLLEKDPNGRIQEIAEAIRRETGAEFVVVGDHEAKRYAHPVVDRLGKHMVGGDSRRALERGETYISKAVGTLGPSIRGKTPIFDSQGDVIGIVSVGYLLEDVDSIIHRYQYKVLLFIPLLLAAGIAAAIIIANRFKKAILGLEPDEISRLLQERTATLETVKEGILAVDSAGYITTINKTAFRTIGVHLDQEIVGKHIRDILPKTEMMNVLKTGESHFDREIIVGDEVIIANRIPIISDGVIKGAVASFRRKDELDRLTKKLSHMETYSDLLRIQTHEYSNKLYTISGLVQIGHYQKAIDLISSETSGYQYIITFLMEVLPDSVLAGLILGKYSQAKELHIEFQIDPNSSMKNIPQHISRERLATILGNLLDNAFDAVRNREVSGRVVKLSMTDLGNDLVFEIDDSGMGIDEGDYDRIFEMGYSTKQGEGFGTGLFLVERAIKKMEGGISVSRSDLGGAAFTVIIPKQERS